MKREEESKKLSELIKKEAEILESLDHEYIINLIEFNDDATYIPNPKDEKEYKVYAIATELAANGSIFDFILSTGRFTEDFARYYFHDLISAVRYMHEEGFVHWDIKLENLALDEKFKLKVIDFGFALEGSTPVSKSGTTKYLAPEAHTGPYDGMKADLFACGVCLFMMVARRNPFLKASGGDPGYAPFINGEPEKFWANQLEQMGEDEGFFSEDFKELVNGLLNPNLEERLDIDDVRESTWMREDVIEDKDALEEMKEKKDNLNKSERGDMPDRVEEDDINDIFSRGGRTRGLGDDSGDTGDHDFLSPKICDRFCPWYRIYTSIFSTEDIDYLWGILVSSCSQAANQLNFTKGKYEIEMIIRDGEGQDDEETKEDEEEGEGPIKISASILEVNEDTHCVEFSPIKGDRFMFQEIYEDIRDYFGGLANVESKEIEEFYQKEEV